MPLYSGGDKRVLVLEAPYYAEITAALIEGATGVLDDHGVDYERIAVTGALELPQALKLALQGERRRNFSGVIAIGCVIRGETSHYDVVCNSTNHWLMKIAIEHGIPLGNAVLTVDTEAQARARAEGGRSGKGGDAARACLRLMALAEDPGRVSR